jgi:hypothetical protein
MNHFTDTPDRLLSIDPATSGFGFVVLEGPSRLLDWGLKTAKGTKQAVALKQIAEIVAHYQPSLIVVEHIGGKGSRRCARVRKMIRAIRKMAELNKIGVQRVSPAKVWEIFVPLGAMNKDQRSRAIADQFPELGPILPPVRKIWMSERFSATIFDAMAFVLTYYQTRKPPR